MVKMKFPHQSCEYSFYNMENKFQCEYKWFPNTENCIDLKEKFEKSVKETEIAEILWKEA